MTDCRMSKHSTNGSSSFNWRSDLLLTVPVEDISNECKVPLYHVVHVNVVLMYAICFVTMFVKEPKYMYTAGINTFDFKLVL